MFPIVVTVIRVLRFLQLAIFVRVMWSWVDPAPRHPVVRTFVGFIDALAKPFRVIVPYGAAAFDLGPLLLMLLVEGVAQLIEQLAPMFL